MTDNQNPEERLARIMFRLMKLRLGEMPRLDYDISFPQMELIGFVKRFPDCRVQDIADGLGITPPSVSVGLRRLEKAGWLERHPDPQDKRATCISLTNKSQKMLQRVKSAQSQGIQQFLIGLSPDEKNQLIELLEKAVAAVEERNTAQDS